MSENSKGPSGVTLWLEDTLSGWTLPLIGLALLVVAGILYLFGRVAEPLMGALIIVAVSLGLALYMAKPALEEGRTLAARVLVWAAAIVTLLVAGAPGLRTIFPGEMLFRGDLGKEGEALAIPPGVNGRVRLLVSGKLEKGGAQSVQFTLNGTEEPLKGTIERTFTTARVGRGGRAQVAHDRLSDFYDVALKKGATELKLERLAGKMGGRLEVEAFHPWLTPLEAATLALVALLFAAVVDARVGLHGNGATTSGMALFFGWLVATFATPGGVVSLAMGAVVLGAMGGALTGATAGAIVRKLVPQMPRRGAAK